MKQKQETVKAWFGSGSSWVWMNTGAVSTAVVMTIGLLAVIAVRGLGHSWLADVIGVTYRIPGEATEAAIGGVVQTKGVPRARLCSAGMPVPEAGPEFMTRELLRLGNRGLYGGDFSWVVGEWLQDIKRPEALMVLECREWGNFYGYLPSVKENGQVIAEGNAAVGELQKCMRRTDNLYVKLYELERGDIGEINHGLEYPCLEERKSQLDGKLDATAQVDLVAERGELQTHYKVLEEQLNDLHQKFNRDNMVMRDASDRESEVTLDKPVYVYQSSVMDLDTKMTACFKELWEFLSDGPREADTRDGTLPVTFGTVTVTPVAALIVTPFGVTAAVYSCEYVKQRPLTRVICITVNNLVGVSAIVYDVSGLGSLVYVPGSSTDRPFFPEALPVPTFNTPGLFQVSLTLVILAVSVVIVATEEGLARVPRAVRGGSLTLGATKAETLWKIVLSMVSPVMMTGLIPTVARAAGEVVPLMLTGVMKLVPSLSVDGNYSYMHLGQKIMHLGFHIYDVGFQSPNIEAARPLIYATALLLVVVIALLNFSTIATHNRLCERHKALENWLRELPM